MNKTFKRGLALLMVLAICIAFVPAFQLETNANSVQNNIVTYRYAGNKVYNWGEREEVATFLSPMAEAFYEKYNASYDKLANYSGGTSQSNASSSDLYDALQELMKNAHSYKTSYNATRDLYQYTDCENNGNVISSFYSGVSIGPAWDGGSTWNREHTWPNSKGLEGSDEDDIMMLRPTASSENFSRGNKAYGESSGYYFPNSESNGDHDVRGDVARIFLYVFVRWENTGKAWGTSGVIENLDILLKWMEEDPVDTWEMGRNDSVQSITGTRNVFIDYPEFAFLLFSEDIPSDMTTPSGIAKNTTPDTPNPPAEECKHTYDSCEDIICNSCGFEREALKHVYSSYCDSTCNRCEKERVVNHAFTDCEDIDCSLCGFEREAINHIYGSYCDNTCNRCGKERIVNHLYAGWHVVVEATIEAVGLEKANCIHCNAETEREIPMLTPPIDQEPDDTEPDIPNEEKPEPPQNSEDEQPVGFFGKIARFFKRIFEKIASIFK